MFFRTWIIFIGHRAADYLFVLSKESCIVKHMLGSPTDATKTKQTQGVASGNWDALYLSFSGLHNVTQFETRQDLHCAQTDVDSVRCTTNIINNFKKTMCFFFFLFVCTSIQHSQTLGYLQYIQSPEDSMSEAVVTVSPKRQYLGIVWPTTPATTGPGHTFTHIHFFFFIICNETLPKTTYCM